MPDCDNSASSSGSIMYVHSSSLIVIALSGYSIVFMIVVSRAVHASCFDSCPTRIFLSKIQLCFSLLELVSHCFYQPLSRLLVFTSFLLGLAS